MLKIIFKISLLLSVFQSYAQVLVNDPTVAYTQDFNALSSVSTTNSYSTLPTGWTCIEVGSNANSEYRADYGSMAGGDLYSYGDATGPDSLERSLGSVGSGSLTDKHFGLSLVNTSSTTINSITIQYTGELWRVGNAQRSTSQDTLHFSYAVNASAINDASFIPFSALSFVSPAGPTDPRNQESVDGNAAGQNVLLQQTINVTLAPNDTLWIRWYDFNSSSYDDALAIDDLSISFQNQAAPSSLFGDLGAMDTYYYEDFDTLGATYNASYNHSSFPKAWFAAEEGTNADLMYIAQHGDNGFGNIYSFGDSLGTDRALGSIGTGNLHKINYGSAWVNSTNQVVNNVEVNFTGEMWRQGRPLRTTGPDTLHFSYAINATDMITGTYTNEDLLSFHSPVINGTLNVPTDGNTAMYQTAISHVLENLNLQPNDTLWIRWTDYNSYSYDDGLAIDDFSIAALTNAPNPPSLFGDLAAMDTYYTEDFDTLGATYGTLYDYSTLPKAWFAQEEGANTNSTYIAQHGDVASGNIYSFGDSLGTDRALGSIGSGGLNKINYGSAWINNTGQVVNNVEVNYTGEMWRQGRPLRSTGPDTLHFSYAINANNIMTGAYANYDLLSFSSPVIDGTLNVPTDGNTAMYQTVKSGVIGNLNLQPNDTLWVRWVDYNSDSYDDGLAIDDFSIAALTTANILTVEFQDDNTYLNEDDGIVAIPITIANPNNFLTQVEVSVASTGTIDLQNDVNLVSSIVSFPAGSTQAIAYFNFEILNSLPFENDEFFVLELSNPSNAFLGTNIFDTIHIANYDYPITPIVDLKSVDANGVADSINKNFLIQGIAHGVNFNYTNGIDFYIIDGVSGMNIFNATDTRNYNFQEGDEVKVYGKISQFKGLTRMENIDSIEVVSTSNTLVIPTDLNAITETEESTYSIIDSLVLSPQIANWPSNLDVQAINLATQDTISIFVSSNSNLANQTAPTNVFKMVGIGSQRSDALSAPYLGGYRLMALSAENQSTTSLTSLETKSAFGLFPNPTTGLFTIQGDVQHSEISVYGLSGQLLMTDNPQSPGNTTLDISALENGVYLVSITKNGTREMIKISKK